MEELWIKNLITSPLQSTSFSSVLNTTASSIQFDKIHLHHFTPLSVPLPSYSTDFQQKSLTPLSRRGGGLRIEKNRKRLSALLENDTPTSSSISSNILSPKTPRLAEKVLKKVAYEDRPNAYLVQWSYGSRDGDERQPTTWEYKDQLSRSCRKLVACFEQSIANDSQRELEFTDYEVEAILDRTVRGELRYLVKWVGWRVPTWEEVKYLLPEYNELIDAFEKHNYEEIRFWADLEKNQTKPEVNSKEPGKSLPKTDHGRRYVRSKLQPVHKCITTPSATVSTVVKAVRVLNKLDRNKQNASYLMLWPREAGIRSNEDPTRSWEKRISLGTVGAIMEFEEALTKRKGWATQSIMYEVEKVQGRRKSLAAEAPLYLVKWSGYEEESWATMESLEICYKHLLTAFALDRLRTLPEEPLVKWEIGRKQVTKKTKAEIGEINKRREAELMIS
uniref:Chromo domain-containing protein n=1 Tax=Globodera rostochiensis TaxID=31243 RepID=A0A914GTA7_GLORO